MMVGVMIPAVLLLMSELYFIYAKKEKQSYNVYKNTLETRLEKEFVEETVSGNNNKKGRSIIAIGIFAIGLLIIGLGVIAEFANGLVTGLGGIILLVAGIIFPWKHNAINHD